MGLLNEARVGPGRAQVDVLLLAVAGQVRSPFFHPSILTDQTWAIDAYERGQLQSVLLAHLIVVAGLAGRRSTAWSADAIGARTAANEDTPSFARLTAKPALARLAWFDNGWAPSGGKRPGFSDQT
jgi:hypothetical protein